MTQTESARPDTSAYDFPTRAPRQRKKWFPFVGLLIVVLSTLLQIGCIKHDLVIDDYQLIQNADGGRGCGNDPIACFSGKLFHLYYRPMLTASFAFVQKYHIHNDNPRWFHIENLFLHAMAVALAIILFRLMLRRRTAALVAGTLFAFHPVQVAVTTFTGGRTDPLVLVFILTFAICVNRAGALYRIANRPIPHGISRLRFATFLLILFATIAFLCAVFTKEQVIPIVFLTPLLVRPRKLFRPSTRGKAPQDRSSSSQFPFWLPIFLVPIMLYSVASGRVLKGDKLPGVNWSPELHVEMIGRTLWYFAKTLFFPTVTTLHQSTLGPWDVPQHAVAALGYLCAALWLVLLVRLWPNRRYRFMALWTTLTLVTCINIVPIPSTFASPYRAAIPLFGIAGLVGGWLVYLPEYIKKRWPACDFAEAMVGVLLVGSLAWCVKTSLDDIPKWQNETTLMVAEVEADPNYIPARAALANYFATQRLPLYEKSLYEYNYCLNQLFGKNIPASLYAALIQTPALQRNMQSGSGPRYTVEYITPILRCRGWDFQSLGRYAEAIDDYNAALKIEPGDSLTLANLLNCYRSLGGQYMDSRNYAAAIEQFKAGLIANPDDRSIRDSLIATYRIVNQKDKADAVFRQEDRFTGHMP